MRASIDPPSELAQMRAMIGIQAVAIEALTRRLAAVEADLTDVRRGLVSDAVSVLPAPAVTVLRRATMAEIAAAVHVKTGIVSADLRGRDRQVPYVNARAIFCGMARRAGYSLQQIGNWLGGRDHTTVMTASQNEARALEYFASMRAAADEVAS